MKNIKSYEKFIIEFVENSKLEYNDLLELEMKIEKLVDIIEEDYATEDVNPYVELSSYPTFIKINDIINTYYGTDYDLDKNIHIVQQLIKDMREQYNMEHVTSTVSNNDGLIDVSIDQLVFDLFPLISVALNKLTEEETHKQYTNERKENN
jgi:hypothetical protein